MHNYSLKQQTNENVDKMSRLKVLRIVIMHLVFYSFVIIYLISGSFALYHIEGNAEKEAMSTLNSKIRRIIDKSAVLESLRRSDENVRKIELKVGQFLYELSHNGVPINRYMDVVRARTINSTITNSWTLQTTIFFAFTIMTTIGYGNITPSTRTGQVLTIVFGMVGIPLFMITIADMGQFLEAAIIRFLKLKLNTNLNQNRVNMSRKIRNIFLLFFAFGAFVAIGSGLLTYWEEQFSYFDGIYFSYISLTTIGLGDIVPNKKDFLLPTMIYITLGLWFTSLIVRQMTDIFRLIHFAGRRVSNVKKIQVWIGAQQISIGDLVQTVCQKAGMSNELYDEINWNSTINNALDGIPLHLTPILPKHFADFIETDPPFIDMIIEKEGSKWSMTFNYIDEDRQP